MIQNEKNIIVTFLEVSFVPITITLLLIAILDVLLPYSYNHNVFNMGVLISDMDLNIGLIPGQLKPKFYFLGILQVVFTFSLIKFQKLSDGKLTILFIIYAIISFFILFLLIMLTGGGTTSFLTVFAFMTPIVILIKGGEIDTIRAKLFYALHLSLIFLSTFCPLWIVEILNLNAIEWIVYSNTTGWKIIFAYTLAYMGYLSTKALHYGK